MVSTNKILLILLSVVLFLPGAVGAQEEPQEDTFAFEEALPEEGSTEFRDIRARIQALLEENRLLGAEHEALKKEFLDLQKNISLRKEEIADLERGSKAEAVSGPPVQDLSSPKADSLGDLREMHMDNLRYQKKELELELQSQKILLESLQKQHDGEIVRLKEKDVEGSQRKRELVRRLKGIETEAPGYPQEIERLTRENDHLKGEIDKLEKMIRSHKKEKKGLLKDDHEMSTRRLMKETIAEKEREHKALQIEIEDLEAKKAALQKKGPSISKKDLDLLRETARQIDEENQRLRSEIFSLRQK